jgi:multiple sugar transport system substrate-binding protein
MMEKQRVNRRNFLRMFGGLAAGTVLASCTPKTVVIEKEVEKEVTRVVKETVKETVVVEGTPQVVEKEVTKVIKETVVVEATTAPPPKEVTLRFQEKGPVQDWTERLVIPVFEDKFPWIDVIFEPRVDGWIDKNLTMMAAGTAPDVIHAWGDVFQRYVSKGQMLDLNPLIDASMSQEDIDDQMPFQWEAFDDPFTGIHFALGRQIDMQIIYYNKDRFDAKDVDYPTKDWTFSDWASMLKNLVFTDDSGRTTTYGAWGWITAWTFMSCHLRSFGGGVRDDETWMICRLSEPGSKEYIEWQRARIWDDKTWITDTELQGIGATGGTVGMFAAENFTMMEANLNSIGQIARDVPFNWDIMHVPVGPGGRYGLGDNDGYGIYAGVVDRGQEVVDAAWELVKFMNGPIHQRINLEQTGECPGRQSLAKEYTDVMRRKFPVTENVNLEMVPESFEMGYLTPGHNFRFQAEAGPIVSAALEKIWEVGDASVDLMDQVCEEVNASQKEALEMQGG